MPLRGRPQQHVVDSGPGPILRVLGNPDPLGDLIRRGEADAVDLLCQGVRILPHRLNGQLPIGLVDSDRSPGTDSVAVEEEHDLSDLHPLLPGIGNPLPTLWADSIDGLQVGGIAADHVLTLPRRSVRPASSPGLGQPLSRSRRPDTVRHPRSWLEERLSGPGLELKTMLLIPDPPAFCGQPLPGAHGRQ